MNFKTWQEAKKVKEQDLIFTRAVKASIHLELLARVSNKMAQFQPSFSEGLAFLETATDLILMGHLDLHCERATDFASWNVYLRNLRYPQTRQRDDQDKDRFEKLPWPYGSKVKFERRGDKAGVELKLFISTASDLTKILASLERVQQDLNK